MILERTVELVNQIYKIHKIMPPKVTKIVIGLGYTGVEVSAYAYEPFLGLASTLPSIINATECNKMNFAGKLTEKPLNELLNWSFEPPSLKKIIGIASLNGVSQHILQIMNPYKKLNVNLIDGLEINKKTVVNFIGLIRPLIRKVSKLTQKITIVENSLSISSEFNNFNVKQNINQLKEEELFCDILFCTGTTLVNDTLEPILNKFKRKSQEIILIGPTASIIPDILFDQGIDIVGGMKILNSEATLQILQEGGGTKLFKKFGKKYNLLRE
ncbi:MAG: Rossmann-like domain-containing protein [Candidatus Odinarchaeota archaeon]